MGEAPPSGSTAIVPMRTGCRICGSPPLWPETDRHPKIRDVQKLVLSGRDPDHAPPFLPVLLPGVNGNDPEPKLRIDWNRL
jgi:hypothetical protein